MIKSVTMEPETLATISRMTTPPSDQKILQYDVLIKSIKSGQGLALGTNNLSTKFDCLYIRAAHDAQAALLNWAKNAHDASGVNSPTFTVDRGYKSNGSSSYLNWNFNPASHSSFIPGNIAVGGYVIEDATRGNKAIFGAIGPSSTINARIFPRTTSDEATFIASVSSGANYETISNTDMRGFYSVSRQATNRTGRKDLVTSVNPSVGIGSFESLNMFECGYNNNGTPTFYLDATVSFTFWGGENVIDRVNLRTSVREYLLSLGVTGI